MNLLGKLKLRGELDLRGRRRTSAGSTRQPLAYQPGPPRQTRTFSVAKLFSGKTCVEREPLRQACSPGAGPSHAKLCLSSMHAKLRNLRSGPPHQVAFVTSTCFQSNNKAEKGCELVNWIVIFNPATFDGALLLTPLSCRMYPLIKLSFFY